MSDRITKCSLYVILKGILFCTYSMHIMYELACNYFFPRMIHMLMLPNVEKLSPMWIKNIDLAHIAKLRVSPQPVNVEGSIKY